MQQRWFETNATSDNHACEKGEPWSAGLGLLGQAQYNSSITACEKGQPNGITYNASITACEKGQPSLHAIEAKGANTNP